MADGALLVLGMQQAIAHCGMRWQLEFQQNAELFRNPVD